MVSGNKFIIESKAFVDQVPIRSIEIEGKAWHYLDNQNKDKPALLLLHGSRGTPHVFWNQFRALGADFRIISIHLPLSDNAKEICIDLSLFLQALSIEKVNILGTSIGGYFAQWFTYYFPEKVAKLFISSSIIDGEGFSNPPHFFSKFILPILPYALIKKGLKKEAQKSPAYRMLNQYIEAMIIDQLSSKELSKRALAFHTNGVIPELNIPSGDIVIIDCVDEPYIDRQAQQKVIEKYPGAKHYRLEKGHHFPYIIAAKEYNQILRREVKVPSP